MRNAAYWAGRMERLNENLLRQADAVLPEMEKAYLRAEESICREIEAFYQRYAGQEGITLAEAKRLLSPSERRRFGLTLEEYIKIGERVPLDPYWQGVLERTSVSVRISRLEALRLQIRQQIELLEGWKDSAMTRTMGDIFRECFYRTGYEIQRGLGVGAAFATLDTEKIGKVLAKPWSPDGKNFSARIWGDDRRKLLHTMETAVTTGIITGESPQKTIEKVRRAMGSSRAAAGRLVLTEGAAFAAMGRKECYERLGVKQFAFLATLDAKTCGACADMDGQVFDLEDYAIGVTAPPLHPNDRCTTVPYFDDGFSAENMRAARDGDGKTYYVPADMTYPEWKKAFVEGDINNLTDSAIGDIMKSSQEKEDISVAEWKTLGKIDIGLLQNQFGRLHTDEIIVTNERIAHIKERHPLDFGLFEQYGKDCVQVPDFIIKDCAHNGTVFMVKKLPDTNLNVVVRLVLESDEKHLKNSVMTFYRIRTRNLKKLIQKNSILYKKE